MQNLTVERIYCDGRHDVQLRLAICDEAERPVTAPPAAAEDSVGGGNGSLAPEEHGQASSVPGRHVFLTYSRCGNGLPFHYSPVFSERYIRHIALAQVSHGVFEQPAKKVKFLLTRLCGNLDVRVIGKVGGL